MMVQRLAAALVLGGLTGSIARADVPPPPPPKGMKYVHVIHKFASESDFPDYEFYSVITSPGNKYTVKAVKLTRTPAVIWDLTDLPRRATLKLTAVPKDAAKKYETEQAFHAALGKGTVAGQAETKDDFWRPGLAPTSEKDTVEGVYTVTKVSAKDGIVIPVTYKQPKLEPGCEADQDGGVSAAPRGGVWVAGLAVAAAFLTGGLWLTRRRVG
jgi:hypothetical protein